MPNDKQKITITGQFSEDVTTVAGLVPDCPLLFNNSSRLVRVRRTESPTAKGIEVSYALAPATAEDLHGGVSELRFIEVKSRGAYGVPKPILSHVLGLGDWPGVRLLRAVTAAPILRGNGTVCGTAGYDPASFVFLADGAAAIPVPSTPTRADAKAAALVLLELVSKFPFADDIDRAAWVAAFLTPFALFAFDGWRPAAGRRRSGLRPGAPSRRGRRALRTPWPPRCWSWPCRRR